MGMIGGTFSRLSLTSSRRFRCKGKVSFHIYSKACSRFAIIIFTNQLGVGLDITESRKRDFQRKIEALSSHIKIPFTLFAALGEDSYRKPNVGMWNLLLEHLPKNIDLKESFFVGDAAGRLKGWKRGKTADHSNADKVFACNIGITFHTPEEFFNGEL